MIVFESAAGPSIRPGEGEIAGRRLAGRLFPYVGESAALRFDPVDRRFFFGKSDASVSAGPATAGEWSQGVSRLPAGPVLVGPSCAAEAVRGAFRAAAEGAMAAGRAVYLLDPEPAGLPEEGDGAVVLCSWSPRGRDPFPALAGAAEKGMRRAALFPLLPGWTAERQVYESLLDAAAAAGAFSATPLVPELDGEARRAIVEARSAVEPEAADRFFELVHHEDWTQRLPGHLREIREACARRGLSTLPPRPLGSRQPAGNAAAAARLEERADHAGADEHRVALLHAAVRWIDESRRDLAAVAREGNFRKIFPFEDEIAAEAEVALEGAL